MEIKKWAAAVLMTPAIASAQVFATPNKGGGEIVITARPCVVNNKNYDLFKEAYAWSPQASKAQACWTISDGNVLVIFIADGDQRVYPINAFREKK
jgi:hypothetical protein